MHVENDLIEEYNKSNNLDDESDLATENHEDFSINNDEDSNDYVDFNAMNANMNEDEDENEPAHNADKKNTEKNESKMRRNSSSQAMPNTSKYLNYRI